MRVGVVIALFAIMMSVGAVAAHAQGAYSASGKRPVNSQITSLPPTSSTISRSVRTVSEEQTIESRAVSRPTGSYRATAVRADQQPQMFSRRPPVSLWRVRRSSSAPKIIVYYWINYSIYPVDSQNLVWFEDPETGDWFQWAILIPTPAGIVATDADNTTYPAMSVEPKGM
jgi:hypothetical protein